MFPFPMSPDPKQSTGIISNHPIIGLIQLAALSQYVALWNDKLGKKTEYLNSVRLFYSRFFYRRQRPAHVDSY